MKSRAVQATLRRRDAQRYRAQLTLLANRIKALKISSALITAAIAQASD